MRLQTAVAALAILAASGCGESGPNTYTVVGEISYQGKPLSHGTVMFVSQEGRSGKTAAIDDAGRYQLEIPAGEYWVQVDAIPSPKASRSDPHAEGGVVYLDEQQSRSTIPEKYRHYDTSGIDVTVDTETENQIDIDLP